MRRSLCALTATYFVSLEVSPTSCELRAATLTQIAIHTVPSKQPVVVFGISMSEGGGRAVGVCGGGRRV